MSSKSHFTPALGYDQLTTLYDKVLTHIHGIGAHGHFIESTSDGHDHQH